jgi:DNA-binding transcriptional LysR family regulator
MDDIQFCMTKDALSWDLYRTFLAVLEEGSLSGAARRLGLAQPTAGRHIEQLEKGLGTPLFLRAPQGLLPTAAALALRPYAVTLAATAAALLRAASSQGRDPQGGLTGTVRISASDVIGVEVLPALLAPLRETHPHLVVELVLSNRIDNLLQGEADIAVRMRRPDQAALLARRIGSIELGLFAHADYLERAGVPEDWQALREHSLIGIDSENAFTRGMQQRLHGLRRDDFSLRSDSYLAQLALIRAGCGIGICQAALARRGAPALRRVLPQSFAIGMDTWLVMHENLRDNPACQAVYTALADGLQAYAGEALTT